MIESEKNNYRGTLEDMPEEYVSGEAVFLGRRVYVEEGVFIPRPETQLLVQKVVDAARKIQFSTPRILELCTGSGAVAVAIASSLKEVSVTCTDVSSKAIEVARSNIERYSLKEKIMLLQSDLYEKVSKGFFEQYDIIASNPPYVSEDGYKYFTDKLVKKEPSEAFLAGEEGLDMIEPIIADGKEYLKPSGLLILEIGFDQAFKVKDIFKRNGYTDVSSCYDHNGFERIVWGKLNG